MGQILNVHPGSGKVGDKITIQDGSQSVLTRILSFTEGH
jgi:hypothetical protein